MEYNDEQLEAALLSGAYTFHNFAVRTWCELTTKALIDATSESEVEDLIHALSSLISLRRRDNADENAKRSEIPQLNSLKTEHESLYETICRLNDFYKICYGSDNYHLKKGTLSNHQT
ncbi:hypothetical protein PG984_013455 [Apiospora sp. TS-2023a]